MEKREARIVKCSSLIAFFVVTLMGFPNANANLIDLTHGAGAGSFELGDFMNGGGTLPFPGVDYMGVASGDDTTITGWSVGGAQGVDWLIEPRFKADTGVHSVDLQHISASSISTDIPTVMGETYMLSFSAAALAGSDNLGTVTAGSLIDQEFIAPSSPSFDTQTFAPFSFEFIATGSTTTIKFMGTDDAGGVGFQYGPVIDSVSVVGAVVPLPAAAWLFGSALLGLVAASRGKRT